MMMNIHNDDIRRVILHYLWCAGRPDGRPRRGRAAGWSAGDGHPRLLLDRTIEVK